MRITGFIWLDEIVQTPPRPRSPDLPRTVRHRTAAVARPAMEGWRTPGVMHAIALSGLTRIDAADEALFDAFRRKAAERLAIAWAVHEAAVR